MAAKKKSAAKKAPVKKTTKKAVAKKAATKKSAKKAAKKTARKKKPSHNQIAQLAQEIYDKRCLDCSPGDQEGDWLEAERRLS